MDSNPNKRFLMTEYTRPRLVWINENVVDHNSIRWNTWSWMTLTSDRMISRKAFLQSDKVLIRSLSLYKSIEMHVAHQVFSNSSIYFKLALIANDKTTTISTKSIFISYWNYYVAMILYFGIHSTKPDKITQFHGIIILGLEKPILWWSPQQMLPSVTRW